MLPPQLHLSLAGSATLLYWPVGRRQSWSRRARHVAAVKGGDKPVIGPWLDTRNFACF
jgi:hypothetical protein